MDYKLGEIVMNQVFGCNTCASADRLLEEFIAQLPLETSHHRVDSQEIKCAFGLQGVCCRLCANGPCRIAPDSPRGICGANADVIVARNFLRAVAAGSGCYIRVLENTARNLKYAAKAGDELRGKDTLYRLGEKLGLKEQNTHKLAEQIAGETSVIDIVDPWLALEGLKIIFELNRL